MASKVKLRTVKLSTDEYDESRDLNNGVCLGCGEWTAGGVEPDARGYECEACGEHLVYGAEEALLMGKLVIVADRELGDDEDDAD